MRIYFIDMIFATSLSFILLCIIFYAEIYSDQLIMTKSLLKKELIAEEIMKKMVQSIFKDIAEPTSFNCFWNGSERLSCRLSTFYGEVSTFTYEAYILLWCKNEARLVRVELVYSNE